MLGSCVFIGPQFRELKWKIQEKVKSLSGIWYTVYTCQCVSIRITASKSMVEHLYEDVVSSVEQTGFLG